MNLVEVSTDSTDTLGKGNICRICYESNVDEEFVSLCNCKGSVGRVHLKCLEHWLAESNSSTCELCGTVYQTERILVHTAAKSLRKWLFTRATVRRRLSRSLKRDVITCSFMIPFSFIGFYFCILTADFYSQNRFTDVVAAKWTSVSLLIMVGMLILAFFSWLISVTSYHYESWYKSWQKESRCRIIFPTEEDCEACIEKKQEVCSNGDDILLNTMSHQAP